jgi:hypothetical protein
MILSRLLRGEETPAVRTNFYHLHEAYLTSCRALKGNTENSAGRFSFARARNMVEPDVYVDEIVDFEVGRDSEDIEHILLQDIENSNIEQRYSRKTLDPCQKQFDQVPINGPYEVAYVY